MLTIIVSKIILNFICLDGQIREMKNDLKTLRKQIKEFIDRTAVVERDEIDGQYKLYFIKKKDKGQSKKSRFN